MRPQQKQSSQKKSRRGRSNSKSQSANVVIPSATNPNDAAATPQITARSTSLDTVATIASPVPAPVAHAGTTPRHGDGMDQRGHESGAGNEVSSPVTSKLVVGSPQAPELSAPETHVVTSVSSPVAVRDSPSSSPKPVEKSTAATMSTPLETSSDPAAVAAAVTSEPRPAKPAMPLVEADPSTPQRITAAPVEPEEHVDGDVVESVIRKLKGTRPEILRTSTYYEGAKSMYMTIAGFPVLSGIAPTVEAVTESLINMTPLKPSPEEQAEQKSVAVWDKRIREALAFTDEVVDSKKDEAIENLVSAKKAINTLGPVQSAVGAACTVSDGVGKAYGTANDTVGNAFHQVFETFSTTYTGATDMAGEAVNNVTGAAESAVKHVTDTTGQVINSATCTAGNTIDGIKSVVGDTTSFIGDNVNWATSTAMSLVSSAIAIPMGLMSSLFGAKKEAAPEE